MIHKSYLIEDNINLLTNNVVLFYGENHGLMDEFKSELLKKNKKIIRFTQDEILKDKNKILNEVQNISLFEDKKIIFLSNVSDKIFEIIKNLQPVDNKNFIYLFGDILDKKSKLRKIFETNKQFDIVPCYNDNELSLKKIIMKKLRNFSGVTPQVITTLINNSNSDRIKINNEINKIKIFFTNKSIKHDLLDKLLNLESNINFEKLRDRVFGGNLIETNKLLSSTVFDIEKTPFYLNIINQRLNKLKEIFNLKKKIDLTAAINSLKPPIFWKDKPDFTHQTKLWSKKKLHIAIEKTYDAELKVKSKADINKNIKLF